MNTIWKTAIGIAAVIIAIIVLAIIAGQKPSQPPAVACTLEAKICPDGSSVGRVGPRCEFALCPGQTTADTSTWKNTSNNGVSFKYPETLGTTYIMTIDWPPQAQLLEKPFSCHPAGSENKPTGATADIMVGGHEYCVTQEVQGAAGSMYTQYAYATSYGSHTAILSFSTKAVQCGNYSEPQQSECTAERTSFDINPIVDKIMQTLVASSDK